MHGLFVFIFLFSFTLFNAQVISKFTWDSNPVTTAIVGPNATSVGTSATSSPGGVGGTNGLNPGSPTADINMVVPNTGNVFDVANIDISIDYRRNESVAQMVKRNNFTFNLGGAGTFQVRYKVGGGTGTIITSTAVNIPSDATFRNYRFTYDNCTGVGTMYVNNAVVWSSPTPTANLNLNWASEGNIVIGQDMDGTGNNIPNLDNFILQPYVCSTLPVELTSFTGNAEGNRNHLKWKTASEKNNDFFTLEKSTDAMNWNILEIIKANGDSDFQNNYSVYDDEPTQGFNYYRLTQTDYNKQSKTYNTILIDNSLTGNAKLLKAVDVLGREVDASCEGLRFLYYSDGSVVKKTGQ